MNIKDLINTSDLICDYKQSIIIIMNISSYLHLVILFVYININVLKMIQPRSRPKKIFIIMELFIIIFIIIFQRFSLTLNSLNILIL